jgi:putative transposase
MARKPRVHLENYTQHVIQRGANRDPCFYAEEDYRCYLDCLSDALARYECECHAYVLMTNHVHLLLTPRAVSAIAQVMKLVGQRFTQYMNHTYRRTGSMWEGRYKASMIDADRYLLTCYRYIELNPVRAGMVEKPSEYRWSSARTNGFCTGTDIGSDPVGLTLGEAYKGLGLDDKARQQAYRELFRDHMDQEEIHELGDIFSQEKVLGNSRFKELIEAAKGV